MAEFIMQKLEDVVIPMKEISISNVKLLAGSENVFIVPTIPFSELVCEFLKELSSILVNHIELWLLIKELENNKIHISIDSMCI